VYLRYVTITQECTTTVTNVSVCVCDPTYSLNTGRTDPTVLQKRISVGLVQGPHKSEIN
jgi:hypothetical protein